jgi:hypothetical protein
VRAIFAQGEAALGGIEHGDAPDPRLPDEVTSQMRMRTWSRKWDRWRIAITPTTALLVFACFTPGSAAARQTPVYIRAMWERPSEGISTVR